MLPKNCPFQTGKKSFQKIYFMKLSERQTSKAVENINAKLRKT